eukprot:m.240918 g.240918  ORF g.240918 m.240918 type:complete len:116 (+) comp10938_c0_seq8:487-834(+)
MPAQFCPERVRTHVVQPELDTISFKKYLDFVRSVSEAVWQKVHEEREYVPYDVEHFQHLLATIKAPNFFAHFQSSFVMRDGSNRRHHETIQVTTVRRIFEFFSMVNTAAPGYWRT